jgi:aryl-phospho-beta-D-glucosidase BglC (GH1 family)
MARMIMALYLPCSPPMNDKRPISQRVLPRWCGFNLLEMFTTRSDGNFQEDDFRWMSEWGFNFARIPACYTLWEEL